MEASIIASMSTVKNYSKFWALPMTRNREKLFFAMLTKINANIRKMEQIKEDDAFINSNKEQKAQNNYITELASAQNGQR